MTIGLSRQLNLWYLTGQPEPTKESRQRRPPTFFGEGCFILLPVWLLAIIGLLSPRQDRLLAEQDAKHIGHAAAWRAFRHQQRLSEMKTRFNRC